ncbi:MAG: hypothetical protein HY934_08975 [Candidatus Firestonebacteria bacterium]|nr:hypothetical protein [Candidatus Firestonebacteria bacterium]
MQNIIKQKLLIVEGESDKRFFESLLKYFQLILTNSKPKIGIMILPEKNKEGELEDVCINSLKNSSEMECIESYIDCISKKTKREPSKKSKSKIYTYIASSDNPELRLGEAAEKGLFNWDNVAFELVKKFLKLIADS